MTDPTEATRRRLIQEHVLGSREQLERDHGQVWDTEQLQAEFSVTGFLAPFVVVSRKSDGANGVMMFQHSPRFYHSFQEDK